MAKAKNAVNERKKRIDGTNFGTFLINVLFIKSLLRNSFFVLFGFAYFSFQQVVFPSFPNNSFSIFVVLVVYLIKHLYIQICKLKILFISTLNKNKKKTNKKSSFLDYKLKIYKIIN